MFFQELTDAELEQVAGGKKQTVKHHKKKKKHKDSSSLKFKLTVEGSKSESNECSESWEELEIDDGVTPV